MKVTLVLKNYFKAPRARNQEVKTIEAFQESGFL